MKDRPWPELEQLARAALDRAVAELPPEIADIARNIPCLLEETCGDDPDQLGAYAGFSPGEISVANGPIILYLRAIDAFCDDELEDYEEQVQLTFLHELGHHLGWEEDDLEERGLE